MTTKNNNTWKWKVKQEIRIHSTKYIFSPFEDARKLLELVGL